MNYKQLHQHWQESLEPIYGLEEVTALLDLALHHCSEIEPARFRIEPQIPSALLKELTAIEKRLAQQEPIQYILGQVHFYQLELNVGPGVLIPRPETEELVAWILEDHPNKEATVIDFCSGSGAIALALKANRNPWKVTGLEWSEAALQIARQNKKALGLDVEFIHADLFAADAVEGTFDIMVSNPPYVRESERQLMNPNVLEHEPDMALFVADDDPYVFYTRIAALAQLHLKPQGTLYLEINEYLSEELTQQLEAMGFAVELRQDLYLKDRMLKCQKK
ncbi:peptide chain release factor N(5)-glutamine methyltransferase [Gilvibacter sediminis]|uniref:peptide chain release factor N(5)-glutamine methyltransferase n=1 Tax=Gilvibacter sediminis TaxID=379071 RepID=UPI002350CC2E|nr:peptide chain release factor N(5)-glutamine methyltransferase [Gilvibacter sediminis]MDC7997838.1 peptide chain release factor N(5)-glutamine methyltransferase [Gilvibacter sediminis]